VDCAAAEAPIIAVATAHAAAQQESPHDRVQALHQQLACAGCPEQT